LRETPLEIATRLGITEEMAGNIRKERRKRGNILNTRRKLLAYRKLHPKKSKYKKCKYCKTRFKFRTKRHKYCTRRCALFDRRAK
jgi:hypothetical protein